MSVSLLRLIYPIRFYALIIYYFQILFLQKAESVLTVELLQHLFGGEMEMDIIYAMPVVFITKWMVKIDLWSNQREGWYVVHTLDIFFRQIATFMKVCVAFVFGLHSKSIKWSCETLQYFLHFYLINALVYINIDLGTRAYMR